MVARPAVLYIADIPVMWLPFVFQDMRAGRRSGIIPPRIGFNQIFRQSPFLRRTIEDIGYYVALNDYMDAQVSMDWRSDARVDGVRPGLPQVHRADAIPVARPLHQRLDRLVVSATCATGRPTSSTPGTTRRSSRSARGSTRRSTTSRTPRSSATSRSIRSSRCRRSGRRSTTRRVAGRSRSTSAATRRSIRGAPSSIATSPACRSPASRFAWVRTSPGRRR